MGQPSYPNSENLEDYFDSINVIDEGIRKETYALMRLDLKALAAKAAWENLTDWTPWLKDSADVTRYYDPPTMGGGRGRDLWLGAGLLSITELRTGISPTSTGSVLVLNQDYRLWPYNAAIEGKPYEMIEFAWSHHGLPRSVSVTGKFGYSETIPDDAWDAILKYGAYLAYQELALAVSGGLYSVRDLNFELRYAGANASPLKLEADGWKALFDRTARQYQRVEL